MNETYRRRLWIIALLVVIVALGLLIRLWGLQVYRGDNFFRFSQNHSLKKIRTPAPRGRIFDRTGILLVNNQPNFVLDLDRTQATDLAPVYSLAAQLLETSPKNIEAVFEKNRTRYPRTQIPLAKNLSPEQVARIRGKISRWQTEETPPKGLAALQLTPREERHYPAGRFLGHLLGYLREASESDLQEWKEKSPGRLGLGDSIGVKGVEKAFEENLRGYEGIRYAFVDALGREVDLSHWGLREKLTEVPPRPGQDVRLTIDAELTELAYRAFGDRVGSLVALDPRDGSILAMVSVPSYHPGQLSGHISPSLWKSLRDDPDNILLNRPLQAAYPPGSTHKVVTAIAALAEGKVDLKEKIVCHGHYRYGNRNWGCWNRRGHGALNLQQALRQSCDVFFYKLGERLGPDLLAHYAKLLGLGQKTGVLEDSERSGLIPTAAWKQKYRHAPWKNSDNLGNAIGQGFNLVTPLQNALMIAQFANGGKRIHPHLLQATRATGEEWQPVPVEPAQPLHLSLDQDKYQAVKEALVQVVNHPNGTAKRARVPGIEVGGKTGTAQVVSLDAKKGRGGKTEDHAWFLAFAPAEDPRIAVAVMVEHGGSGGAVAAPIAQQVLQAFFNKKEKQTLVGSLDP